MKWLEAALKLALKLFEFFTSERREVERAERRYQEQKEQIAEAIAKDDVDALNRIAADLYDDADLLQQDEAGGDRK